MILLNQAILGLLGFSETANNIVCNVVQKYPRLWPGQCSFQGTLGRPQAFTGNIHPAPTYTPYDTHHEDPLAQCGAACHLEPTCLSFGYAAGSQTPCTLYTASIADQEPIEKPIEAYFYDKHCFTAYYASSIQNFDFEADTLEPWRQDTSSNFTATLAPGHGSRNSVNLTTIALDRFSEYNNVAQMFSACPGGSYRVSLDYFQNSTMTFRGPARTDIAALQVFVRHAFQAYSYPFVVLFPVDVNNGRDTNGGVPDQWNTWEVGEFRVPDGGDLEIVIQVVANPESGVGCLVDNVVLTPVL